MKKLLVLGGLLISFSAAHAGGNSGPGGITALTGDVTASGTGSASATLATVNSNVGSFTSANITVDAKGRVTAAANGGGTGTFTNLTVSGKLIFTGAAPTITAGTATLDATASNQAGTVTEGTAQTGFTLTFNTANPFTTTPHCTVSSPNGSALTSYTPSTTTLVVANMTATGSSFTYVCVQ
jgi:hypothetical protein